MNTIFVLVLWTHQGLIQGNHYFHTLEECTIIQKSLPQEAYCLEVQPNNNIKSATTNKYPNS